MDPIVGEMDSVSTAASRMYARPYADMHQDRIEPMSYRYGKASYWAQFFVSPIALEGLIELKAWHKGPARDRARKVGSEGLSRWRNKVNESPWQKNIFPIFDQGSDIAGNYPILIGIKEGSFNEVQISKTLSRFESRSEHLVPIEAFSHLEVPLNKVAETRARLASGGYSSIFVLSIELGEYFCSKQSFSDLISGDRLTLPGGQPPSLCDVRWLTGGGAGALVEPAGAGLVPAGPPVPVQVVPDGAGRRGAGWPGPPRYDDLALLAVTSLGFALGAGSAEGTGHLIASEAGPLAGIGRLPHLRTLRPRLAAIAGGCDPLGLQRRLAVAMLAADAPGLQVYYVDDHFVPYEGAKPVPKGWNTKRRHAQKGRADTVVTDYHGRAVCFASGDPSGLAATMASVLGQLREVTGPGKKIMLGFGRGGSYPRCSAPSGSTTRTGSPGGAARSRSRPPPPAATGPPAATADPPKSWNWPMRPWPSRTTARPGRSPCSKTAPPSCSPHQHLDSEPSPSRACFAALLASPALPAAAKNAKIPAAQQKITEANNAAAAAKAALGQIPAKLPANQVTPGAQKAVLRTRHRALQMVLRLLAANAEDWLAHRLNAYLRDNDEYRAITRNLLHLGGTITYTPATVTVTLDTPAAPRITRASACSSTNSTPPRPGSPATRGPSPISSAQLTNSPDPSPELA